MVLSSSYDQACVNSVVITEFLGFLTLYLDIGCFFTPDVFICLSEKRDRSKAGQKRPLHGIKTFYACHASAQIVIYLLMRSVLCVFLAFTVPVIPWQPHFLKLSAKRGEKLSSSYILSGSTDSCFTRELVRLFISSASRAQWAHFSPHTYSAKSRAQHRYRPHGSLHAICTQTAIALAKRRGWRRRGAQRARHRMGSE